MYENIYIKIQDKISLTDVIIILSIKIVKKNK